MRNVALKPVDLIGPRIQRALFSYEFGTAARIGDSFTYPCSSALYRRLMFRSGSSP